MQLRGCLRTFLLLIIFTGVAHSQNPTDLPWSPTMCNGASTIYHEGVVAITCGTVESLPVSDRYTFGIVGVANSLPGTGRVEITNMDSVYHHPTWLVTELGTVFGLTSNPWSREVFVTASANYGERFWNSQAINQYGNIGGGAQDLAAAGSVYRIDPVTGAATVFAVLPQQATTFAHWDCEADVIGSNRTTGPGLGNIDYDDKNKTYYVTNAEDGRIYRLDYNGTILDSYDPFTYDNGAPGVHILEEQPYGIAVEPGSNRLFFGTNFETTQGTTAGVGTPGVYSIDLNPDGSFAGTVNNTTMLQARPTTIT